MGVGIVQHQELLDPKAERELCERIGVAKRQLYNHVFCHEPAIERCMSLMRSCLDGEVRFDSYASPPFASKANAQALLQSHYDTIVGIQQKNIELLEQISTDPNPDLINIYHVRIDRVSLLFYELGFHAHVMEDLAMSLDNPYIASLGKGLIALKHEMICKNIPLVVNIAKYYTQVQGISISDAFSEGCIGLMRAVDLYQPSMGNRFSTYAVRWIRGHIVRCIIEQSRMIRVPSHVVEAISKVKHAQRDYQQADNRIVTDEEAIMRCGLRQKDKSSIIGVMSAPVSLDTSVVQSSLNGKQITLSETIESEIDSPEELCLQNQRQKCIENILDKLDYREKMIIKFRYGIGDGYRYTLQEIGRIFMCSRERVRQIESNAMRKLMSGGNLAALRSVL